MRFLITVRLSVFYSARLAHYYARLFIETHDWFVVRFTPLFYINRAFRAFVVHFERTINRGLNAVFLKLSTNARLKINFIASPVLTVFKR